MIFVFRTSLLICDLITLCPTSICLVWKKRLWSLWVLTVRYLGRFPCVVSPLGRDWPLGPENYQSTVAQPYIPLGSNMQQECYIFTLFSRYYCFCDILSIDKKICNHRYTWNTLSKPKTGDVPCLVICPFT